MDRRHLLKSLAWGTASFGILWRHGDETVLSTPPPGGHAATAAIDPPADEGALSPGDAAVPTDRLEKIRHFDRWFSDDVLLPADRLSILRSSAARLERARRLVGHGNFNLLSFDQLLRYAKSYEWIGPFSPNELAFLDEIYHADARQYGFFGDKVVTSLTGQIAAKEVEKIAGTGHYLFRGQSREKFRRIRGDLGEAITLTSGVRGLVKQYQLFLSKAVATGGNLSQASRSLAPPGYSHHARGDFDLGKVGLGLGNFTRTFAETDEYRRLIDLGYVKLRYHEENALGVRHEPWHIKLA